MKKYTKEILLGIFLVAIVGLSVIQYQYARIGLYVARIQFQKHLSDGFQDIQLDLMQENDLTLLTYLAIIEDSSYLKLPTDSIQLAATGFLHDFLRDRLLGAGVRAKFGYTLILGKDGPTLLEYLPYGKDSDALSHTVYLSGYLEAKLGEQIGVKFIFHDLDNYLLQRLNGIVIPSILCMLLIILLTIWVFRRTYYQNRVITTTNDFINNLTHELKTPVFSIGIATKLLENDPQVAGHPALEHIKQQNNRLKEHIEKVMSLAEMEQQGYVMQLTRQDIAPFLAELVQEYQLKAKVEGFDFQAVFPERVILKTDWPNFRNALVNLIENAIKYGGGGLVTLSVKEEERYYHFRVEDQGPGIPENRQEDIFKKFYRITDEQGYQQKGYGLGLHYVRQVMQFHKGRIRVESEPGEGTAFVLVLPKEKVRV